MAATVSSFEESFRTQIKDALREVLAEGQQKTPPAKRLFTVEEAANYLTLSPRSISELTSTGKLTAVRQNVIGKRGRVMYDIADLDKWIESSKR